MLQYKFEIGDRVEYKTGFSRYIFTIFDRRQDPIQGNLYCDGGVLSPSWYAEVYLTRVSQSLTAMVVQQNNLGQPLQNAPQQQFGSQQQQMGGLSAWLPESSGSIFDVARINLESNRCNHEIKTYNSGWTSYDYCVKCNAKMEGESK